MESDGCCPCGHTGIFRCSSAPCQRIGRNGKSAVQNETVSGTENGTETKRAAVYVNLKTGDDTADGTTAETAVKTVEKAQELLAVAAAELQADGKTTEKTLLQIPAKRQRRKQQKNIWYSSEWMKKSWKRIERNSRKQTSGKSNRYRFCGR